MKRLRFNKMISVIIDEPTFNKVKTITDERMVSVSEWIRGLVQKELQKEIKQISRRK